MKAELSSVSEWSDRFPQINPRGPILQAGAICWRMGREALTPEVLLIASRRNGGWGIPKGHIELGETSRDAAQREAFEEAGVIGHTMAQTVGSFVYSKNKDGRYLRYTVTVHLLHVHEIAAEFPEKNHRVSKWVPVAAAGRQLGHAGLRRIFDAANSQSFLDTFATS